MLYQSKQNQMDLGMSNITYFLFVQSTQTRNNSYTTSQRVYVINKLRAVGYSIRAQRGRYGNGPWVYNCVNPIGRDV